MDFGLSSDDESDDESKSSGNLSEDLENDFDEDVSDEELFEREFLVHKRDYYITKLKYPEMTE